MPSPTSDRALDHLVSRLAGFDDAARTAVLNALDDNERTRVVLLLEGGSAKPAVTSPSDLTNLSPWLADLVRSGRTMTPYASAVLAECADKQSQIVLPKARCTPSLLGRAVSLLRPRKAAR